MTVRGFMANYPIVYSLCNADKKLSDQYIKNAKYVFPNIRKNTKCPGLIRMLYM